AAPLRRGGGQLRAGTVGGSRRSAGALQPDALLPGDGRHRACRARAAALHAVQGRRSLAVDPPALPPQIDASQQRETANPRARRSGEPAEIAEPITRKLMPRTPRALPFVTLSVLFAAAALAIVSGATVPAVTFVDVTEQARIHFTHNNGAS